MTLTTRLLLFYLGSVAAILIGFSSALYLVARDHLYRQADERLDAAMNTLGAAVEIGPNGVEWEPNERTLRLSSGQDQIAWVVTDDAGAVVARSERPGSDDLLADASGRFRGPADGTRRLYWRGERCLAGQRWFVPGGSAKSADFTPLDPKEVKYPALVVTAALPLEPTRTVLRNLLAVLGSISFIVLFVALIVSRFVCRRALSPVCRMADDARSIESTDLERRLSVPNGGDELTDLGTAFNALLDRLHEAAERHRQFAGDASHQLRTPLTALLGQIEVALRRERTPDEYRDVLTVAQAKANHLHRIVEALLVLTREGSGTDGAGKDRLNLSEWLPDFMNQWSCHSRSGDLRIVRTDGTFAVMTHPVLLGEVLNVLIDNAFRYSPPGSPVVVSLARSGSTAHIEVADAGQGIAAADQPQVFTPFFRTTDGLRANKHGIGLGLSIAQRLLQALGGDLRLISQAGEGSRFIVILPATTE